MSTISKILTSSLYAVSLLLASCSMNENYVKPPATGKIGDLVVIIDKVHWDSEPGDSLRGIFSRPYPMLPQIEKTFNLLSMPYTAFNPSMQLHRNIVMVNISKEYPLAKIMTQHDTWATPQIVVNIVGPDAHSVSTVMSEKKELLIDLFEQAECSRQSEIAVQYEEAPIRQSIEKAFNIRMYVPNGYTILTQKENFIWMENRTNRANQGIMIYSYPFTEDSTFTVKYLVNKRNAILHKFVPGQRDSSWMTTAKYPTPMLKIKKLKEQVYGELRGLWDVENDYMGGPFVSRSYVDRKENRIVTVEGYVYAPQSDKRDYLRRVEGVINTFSLDLNANQSQKDTTNTVN